MSMNAEAWLEIETANGTIAQFQFEIGLQGSTDTTKNFVMAERGQFLQEIFENRAELEPIDSQRTRRAGFYIDGGAGSATTTFEFTTGTEAGDITWGDGSGGTGSANVTKTDASGPGIHPLTRKQVLEYWIRRTRTDSFGQARLHRGEWTDGTVGSASAGVYDQPIPVAVEEASIDEPDPEKDINSINGSITVTRIDIFADSLPLWVTGEAEKAQAQTNGVEDN